MTLFSESERTFVEAARVARLATIDESGVPHVLPICFVLIDTSLWTPLDKKAKSVSPDQLTRVKNIRHSPQVGVVVDRYCEDWSRLGWVQMRGRARLIRPGGSTQNQASRLLRNKYPPYQTHDLKNRPMIQVDVNHVISWGSLEWET